jgi:hypothetical protein
MTLKIYLAGPTSFSLMRARWDAERWSCVARPGSRAYSHSTKSTAMLSAFSAETVP